ncbi:MAG: sugar ABC transporter permease, partial [Actinobacteria bacterium]|nr:sugar ABC transporter permease [Actinomycetota bacterium]
MAATVKAIAPAERRRMTPRKWLSHLGWRHLVGLVAVVYAAFPVVYVVSASLTTDGTQTGSNQLFQTISGANFAALNATKFWAWMGNTLVIAVATAIGTVVMGAAAAYAFSRFRF